MTAPTLDELKRTACAAIDKQAGALAEVAQSIWNNPELNYEEVHAHRVLADLLESNGLSVERHYVVDTAFRATYGKSDEGAATNNSNIAILCEYDALPGIGHACGHNLIAEVGAGAGIGVKAALHQANTHGLQLGQVTVLGTPAEEGGGGKIDLIKAGTFDSIDAAMMCHPCHANCSDPGDSMFAIERVDITYKGKASHAAAFPSEGVNALDAAVLAYNNISVLRQQMKSAWKVHGIIFNGGSKPNIIPEEASLKFFLRATNLKEMAELKAKAVSCFQAAALATGCTVEYEWEEKPYSNLVSNNAMTQTYDDNKRLIDIGACITKDDLARINMAASTDMGNVSYAVPSIHPMYAIGGTGKEYPHMREFTKLTGSADAQAPTLKQAKLLALTAIDLLYNQQLLRDVKQEFLAAMK